jgi:YbbR domain-containing protein
VRKLFETATNNWQLKLTALALAFLLWLAVQSGKPYRYRMSQVPVRIVNHDAEYVVSNAPTPAFVSIEFFGRFRDLMALPASGVEVRIPVENVSDTSAAYGVRRENVDFGSADGDVTTGSIRPDTVHVSFDRIATRLVILRATLAGAPPSGYSLVGPPTTDPQVVRVSGPSRRLARMDTIHLPAIDISRMTGAQVAEVTIDTTNLGVTVSPRRIRVTVPLQSAQQQQSPPAGGGAP